MLQHRLMQVLQCHAVLASVQDDSSPETHQFQLRLASGCLRDMSNALQDIVPDMALCRRLIRQWEDDFKRPNLHEQCPPFWAYCAPCEVSQGLPLTHVLPRVAFSFLTKIGIVISESEWEAVLANLRPLASREHVPLAPLEAGGGQVLAVVPAAAAGPAPAEAPQTFVPYTPSARRVPMLST